MKITKQSKYTYSTKFLRRYVEFVLLFFPIKDPKALRELARRMDLLFVHNGPEFSVRYLKQAHLMLNSFVAGNPLHSHSGSEWVATVRGVPRIIPGSLRLMVEAGNPELVRVISTLLTYYRVVKIPGILKLNTITDSFKGVCDTVPVYEIKEVMKNLRSFLPKTLPKGSDRLIPSTSAGPSYKVAILGAPLDALSLLNGPAEVLKAFHVLSDSFGSSLSSLLEEEIKVVSRWNVSCPLLLGKLSKKMEPAGKIRVFAIVDIWTQSVLEPLHELIFSILRKIPQDGCFNQAAPLRKLQERINEEVQELGSCNVYSFDLSAATDRLPLKFQVQVLGQLLNHYLDNGSEVARAWADLLIGRSYRVDGQDLKYTVGQPMGALSSWGMLSLTHHIIVQLCAHRVGYFNAVTLSSNYLSAADPKGPITEHRRSQRTDNGVKDIGKEGKLPVFDNWFSEYAILGDDIVIADKSVAMAYLTFVRDILGVDININKSIISSTGVVEFAKRLVTPNGEVSPLGAGGVSQCLRNIANLPALVTDYVGKSGNMDWSSVVSLLDRISSRPDVVRIRRKTVDGLMWSMVGPLGLYPVPDLSSSRMFKFAAGLDPKEVLRHVSELSRVLSVREARSAVLKARESLGRLSEFVQSFGALGVKGQALPGFGTDQLMPPSYQQLLSSLDDALFTLESNHLKLMKGDLSNRRLETVLNDIEQSILAKSKSEMDRASLWLRQILDSISDLIRDRRTIIGVGDYLHKPRVVRPRVRNVDTSLIKALRDRMSIALRYTPYRHVLQSTDLGLSRGKAWQGDSTP